jgi:hypothetical protein
METLVSGMDMDQEKTKQIMELKLSRFDSSKEEMRTNPAKMETLVCGIEMDQEQTEPSIHSIRSWRRDVMVCQEKTEEHLECKELHLRGHGIRSGVSGGPQGTLHSETCLRTEEALYGPEFSHRALPKAERKCPGKFWIPEQTGRRPQVMTPGRGGARRKVHVVRKNQKLSEDPLKHCSVVGVPSQGERCDVNFYLL